MPPSGESARVSRNSSELGIDPIPATTKRDASQICFTQKAYIVEIYGMIYRHGKREGGNSYLGGG